MGEEEEVEGGGACFHHPGISNVWAIELSHPCLCSPPNQFFSSRPPAPPNVCASRQPVFLLQSPPPPPPPAPTPPPPPPPPPLRQSNWKLDPPLRKACRDDVSSYCAAADSKDSEEGLVYQCMVRGEGGQEENGEGRRVMRGAHLHLSQLCACLLALVLYR